MGPFTFPNTSRTRWFFWAVVGLTALAAAIRFSTLGLQSYRHDEAVTAGRVLLGSLSQTMHEVWAGESTPPLYYLVAWLWSHLFGVHEVGLRSLSALFGTATVPVAYLVGRELVGRRVGVAIAAIVAVEPMLVWYSQDARAYALLVLLSTLSFLFFARALRASPRRRAENPRHTWEIGPSAGKWDLGWWAALSALALAAHYFAFFPLAIEAAWLLTTVRPVRRVLWSVGAVALAGLALAPIALHQAQGKNNDWIATFGMAGRLRETAIAFFAGEAGLLKHALIPMALFAAAVGLLLVRGGAREKRGAAVALAIGGGGVLLALALAAAGQDFVLERNLLPELVPLALIGAAGIAAPRAGWLGIGVGAALVAYLLAFCVYSDLRPALQRDDWRRVAREIGPPRGPRAILVWEQGDEPLAFYIGAGETRVKWKEWHHAPTGAAGKEWRRTTTGVEGKEWRHAPTGAEAKERPRGAARTEGKGRGHGPIPLVEVDVVSGRPPPPGARSALPPGFHRVQRIALGRMTLIRYRAARARPLGWGALVGNFTGYGNNAVLIDGLPNR